ncbi:hypothetical protein MP228_001324 [Amoeboaphelidium protococcarum]|nr:hypothetical protein MP228_001324 [Amoeboaphelidium protococcarum]
MIRTFHKFYSQLQQPLKVTLKNDLKSAMISKDSTRVSVVKSLIADLSYADKVATAKSGSMSEVDVIRANIKKRLDSIAEYRKAQRDDLATKEQSELDIVQSYIPTQMSQDEVTERMSKLVSEQFKGEQLSTRDMKRVMSAAKSQFDPNRVSMSALATAAQRVLNASSRQK